MTEEITQADRQTWEDYGPEIFHGAMTGPELVAKVRTQAGQAALTDALLLVQNTYAEGPCVGVLSGIERNLQRLMGRTLSTPNPPRENRPWRLPSTSPPMP